MRNEPKQQKIEMPENRNTWLPYKDDTEESITF
jgi:hypothetical protein